MQLKKILNQLLSATTPMPVLIFSDPGVDDALMLWQILSASRYEILGIIVGAGNTNRTQTINNAQRIVAVAGRADVKVYAGCEAPLDTPVASMLSGVDVYGDDGLNGIKLPKANSDYIVADGIDFAYEQICQQPVCIISTGGMTDVYRVLSRIKQQAPEKFKNILAISMMAGVINATQEANAPIAAIRQSEFNIIFDIKASKDVFALTAQYNLPILLTPLDLTHSVLCSQQDAALFKKLHNPVADYFYQLLNSVPEHYVKRYGEGPDGSLRQPIHDLHASNALIHPEQYRGSWAAVAVDEQGKLTVTQEQQANVFLLQFLYLKRKEFFRELLNDLRHYNYLTFNEFRYAYPKVIVFDLDDTLWDCLQHYRHHINNTRERFGLPRWNDDNFNNFGYVNREHMFQHMFGNKVYEALEHFYELFNKNIPNEKYARLLQNVEELLKMLRAKGVTLIAWSNTEDVLVQRLIDHFNLRPYFDHVMGSNGHTNQWQDLKPNPQLFEIALQKLNLTHIDRREIWFVGDSLTSDIKCGHNAGCITAWYNPKKKQLNTADIKPHLIITSFEELEIKLASEIKIPSAQLLQQMGMFSTGLTTASSSSQQSQANVPNFEK